MGGSAERFNLPLTCFCYFSFVRKSKVNEKLNYFIRIKQQPVVKHTPLLTGIMERNCLPW